MNHTDILLYNYDHKLLEMLTGNLLGDGNIIIQKNRKPRFRFGHSIKEKNIENGKFHFLTVFCILPIRAVVFVHLQCLYLQNYILIFMIIMVLNTCQRHCYRIVHCHIFYRFYIWMTALSASLQELTLKRKKSISHLIYISISNVTRQMS